MLGIPAGVCDGVTIGANNYPYTLATASNRLNATAGPSPAKTLTHDAAGNVTADGTQSFVYSNRGRMSSTTRGSSTVEPILRSWPSSS